MQDCLRSFYSKIDQIYLLFYHVENKLSTVVGVVSMDVKSHTAKCATVIKIQTDLFAGDIIG